MKLHTLVQRWKGYNLTKGHKSAILSDKIMPPFKFEDRLCVDYRGVNNCDNLGNNFISI